MFLVDTGLLAVTNFYFHVPIFLHSFFLQFLKTLFFIFIFTFFFFSFFFSFLKLCFLLFRFVSIWLYLLAHVALCFGSIMKISSLEDVGK